MQKLLILIILILHLLKIYGDYIEIDVDPNSNESLEPYDSNSYDRNDKKLPINLLGNSWRYIKNKLI